MSDSGCPREGAEGLGGSGGGCCLIADAEKTVSRSTGEVAQSYMLETAYIPCKEYAIRISIYARGSHGQYREQNHRRYPSQG
jgi:hypothetical protein